MKKIVSIFFALFLIALQANADGRNLLPKPQIARINFSKNFIIKDKTLDDADAFSVKYVDSLKDVPFNQQEAYKITIDENGVAVFVTTKEGLFRAKTTLKQLSTITIDGHDTGRGYIPIEVLKKQVELLSYYKINTFHWHLTENIAWRLESKLYPQLNDSSNMLRLPGKFYPLEQVKEFVEFCKKHYVTVIPEIDMPGHSDAFTRAFGYDMQSKEGTKKVKELLDEAIEVFDVPYIHIGTDEVKFTNPDFVDEIVAYVRSKGKKVISWNPGWKYKSGEIDMTHLWSYRGKAYDGILTIDSKFHYLNHFDTFGDIIALYTSKIYNADNGANNIAGSILAVWNDRKVKNVDQILLENNFYPNMLAIAERSWLGGGLQYFDKDGTILYSSKDTNFVIFQDFERRMLWHKHKKFANQPFGYVKQTNIEWGVTDMFDNQGDLSKKFPPEDTLQTSYSYQNKTYKTRKIIGAGAYLRHTWGTLVPGVFKQPKENHTAYAYTWVYSPYSQDVGAWIDFQNYSRSEKDLPPPAGEWDYKKSKIWLNDIEIKPPKWENNHVDNTNEIALANENMVTRQPILVHLNKGWNKVLVKLPVGKFRTHQIRLVKWMFSVVFVTKDGSNSINNLVYSTEKKLPSVKRKERNHSTYYYQKKTLFDNLPVDKDDIIFLGNSITDGCD